MNSGQNTTFRVEISHRAARDLDRLYIYINAAQGKQAADWSNRLEATINSLAASPERRTYIDAARRRRRILYGKPPRPYRIVYTADQNSRLVLIHYIRHGARVGAP